MLRAIIKLETLIPNNVTKAEAKEWLRYQLRDNGEMSAENPLVDEEFEPHFFEVQFVEHKS